MPEIPLSRGIALVLATGALVGSAAWALRASRRAEDSTGRSPCEGVDYSGPATRLYADRPYHTRERVAPLVGHRFCRGRRHGRDAWILAADRATTLYAIASEQHRLEQWGWEALPEAVRVEAAGLPLDRLYRKRIDPGRHAIPHGRARTAYPVFWNPRDARVVAPAPADG